MLTAHQLAPQHIPRAGSRRRRSIPHFRGTVHVAAPDPMSMILYVCYCVCLDEVCFLRYPSTVTMGRVRGRRVLYGGIFERGNGARTDARPRDADAGGTVRCGPRGRGPFPCGSSLEWRRSRSRDRGRSPRSRTGRGRRARGTSRLCSGWDLGKILGSRVSSDKSCAPPPPPPGPRAAR